MKSKLELRQAMEVKRIAFLKAEKEYQKAVEEYTRKAFSIKVTQIQVMTATAFGISIDRMLSGTHKRNIVDSRQMSMLLSRENTDMSLASIGDLHEGKDHATVIHACKTIKSLIDTNSNFRILYNKLSEEIKMLP